MDPLIILIHIPKTAGTSIRVAAELYFTPSRVLYDYGPDARQTSCLVREFIYQRQDYTGFAEAVEEQGFRFFCGHFPLSRYREVFPNARFCSWLREPAERLWSAWRYAVKQDGYAGSFADFYEKPGRRDRMCKMLGQDASELDFVGSTEDFTHSLERFNQLFKVNFRQYRANENEATAGGRISEEDARRVRALNEKDCALYRSVIGSLKRQRTDVVLETSKQTLFQRLSTHTRSALARFGGRGAAEMKPSVPGKNVELDMEIERLKDELATTIELPDDEVIRQSGPFPSSRHFFESAFKSFKELRIYTSLNPASRVLDYGCGLARLAIPFSSYLHQDGGSYLGLDTNKNCIERNQTVFDNLPHVRFDHVNIYSKMYNRGGGSIQSLFELDTGKPFDLACLFSVFTHVLPEDCDALLRFLGDRLEAGGELFCSWFLLNRQTENNIKDGLAFRSFSGRYGIARVDNPEVPEGAVAYPEKEVLRRIRRAGFIDARIHYGKWRGGLDSWLFQDVIVARKKGACAR